MGQTEGQLSAGTRRRQFVAAVCFPVILGVLLGLATIFDLQVSRILAGGLLEEGTYFTSFFPCNLIEIVGAWPIWTAMVLAGAVLTVWAGQLEGGKRNLRVLFFVLMAAAAVFFMRDVLKYSFQIYGNEEWLKTWWCICIFVAFGLAASLIVLKLTKNWISGNLDKLLSLALAVLCCCACFLLIEMIKGPMGRMRFRAMHMIGDDSFYTPWYQVSRVKGLLADRGLAGDCFKSFPSGHTFSAGISYVMIMFPDVFPAWRERNRKILSYVLPFLYTGLVAVGRIAAGAHFFSDVLVGGSLAYLAVQVFRFVFLYRPVLRKGEKQTGKEG